MDKGFTARERLCRECLLTTVLRYGSLLDAVDRLAGDPIEHEVMSHLGPVDDDLAPNAVDHDVEKRRGRYVVVVPNVMMHRLEVPAPLSGLGVQGEETVGEEVRSASGRSIRARIRTAEAPIDEPEVWIDRGVDPRDDAPDCPRVAFPRFVSEFAGPRSPPEAPHQAACLGVESICPAARTVGAALHAHVDQSSPVDDRARECGAAQALKEVVVVALAHERSALLSFGEQLCLPDRLAGFLIERVNEAIARGGEHQAFSNRDAAHVGGLLADVGLPFDGAGPAVDRKDILLRGLDVQYAILRNDRALLPLRGIAAFEIDMPSPTETVHVVSIDAAEDRVVLVREVAADLGEVATSLTNTRLLSGCLDRRAGTPALSSCVAGAKSASGKACRT